MFNVFMQGEVLNYKNLSNLLNNLLKIHYIYKKAHFKVNMFFVWLFFLLWIMKTGLFHLMKEHEQGKGNKN